MDDRYAELPIADLVQRWERLPQLARADAFGYMSSAVERARVAIDMAEKFAQREAVTQRPVHRPKLRMVRP